MMNPQVSGSTDQGPLDADSLLRQFISIEDEANANVILEVLISEHAKPLVHKVIRRRLSDSELQDEEDICNEALYRLLVKLGDLRASGNVELIESLPAYVARIAQNEYNGYLKDKHPRRSNFKNHLRYLLNHRAAFATWENSRGELVCGLKDWKDANQELTEAPEVVDLNRFLQEGDRIRMQANKEDFIEALFNWCGRPILLDDLVTFLAKLEGIHDLQEVNTRDYDEVTVCDLLVDPAPDPGMQLDQKLYLERLWQEICELPARQRVALLLNLRDAAGNDALILFTLKSIASLRKIAEVVEFKVDAFAKMWNQLPLDDNSIALCMGITRQQVINLRKTARERLARRMTAYSKPKKGKDR